MWQAGVVAISLCVAFSACQDFDNDDFNENDRPRAPAGMAWSEGSECRRECRGASRLCYFRLIVEKYTVLGPACRNCTEGRRADCWAPQCVPAEGTKRGIITINRQMPGPDIQVCLNDMIVVDLVNGMVDQTTSIHWHGIRMVGTPHMDGVPMVTQCPIHPGTTFRYSFNASEAGTFFYHSHTGSQKLDGVTGALIVRMPRWRDIHRDLYQHDLPEHVIFVQDWIHIRSEDFVPGLHRRDIDQVPNAFLINGIGPISSTGVNRGIPMANFTVESGRRYRFRLVSGTCMTCAVAIRIEGHRLLAISADGGLNFQPVPVDSIVLNSADRFDFVLNANQTAGTYYIFAQSVNDFCGGLRQVAVLRYASSGTNPIRRAPPPTGDLGVQLNAPNGNCDGSNQNELCVSMLSGESHAPMVAGQNTEYLQYHVSFGFYLYDVDDLFAPGTYQRYEEPVFDRLIMSLANNISFTFPPSPMLTQWNDIPRSALCRRECYSANIQKACSCANVYPISLGTVVDLVVFDTGERDGFVHPFHLHGYNFYVLEMGVLNPRRQSRQRHLDAISNRVASDQVNVRWRPMRDTINIPARGYAVLRFVADNPGYWLFHCHFAYHLESGMAAVYKVGEDDEMPRAPRGFPTCGNFLGR